MGPCPPGVPRFSLVLTLDSLTLPWARSEYVDGIRIAAGEVKWNQARAGAGLAWRMPLPPGECDNGLDAALTYEPGGLWFSRGSDTAPGYAVPRDTYEGRLHLRLRADALERNLLEMPHRGFAAGLDGLAGWRSRWDPWGFPAALETGGRNWQAVSGFAYAAFAPAPGLSERHRLVASLHAGTGSDLDRFSAFRLGGGSTWGDFETLSRVVLPGAGVDEFYSSRYAIADLEYRYEALFFLYLQVRGTLAWADRPVSSGRRDGEEDRLLPRPLGRVHERPPVGPRAGVFRLLELRPRTGPGRPHRERKPRPSRLADEGVLRRAPRAGSP